MQYPIHEPDQSSPRCNFKQSADCSLRFIDNYMYSSTDSAAFPLEGHLNLPRKRNKTESIPKSKVLFQPLHYHDDGLSDFEFADSLLKDAAQVVLVGTPTELYCIL
ncbi:hypothetical protein Ciccas_011315 [Cichlidogyrus casuarinus]|uniref:Uncharacterized protein n=1 Tax=Cichlidogyrus casuarinus TaxID=1844966 RepID=A0ABD2PST3_9PLAT